MDKVCCKCQLTKPNTEFYKQQRNRDGLRYDCKVCANLAVQSSKQKNPIPYREASKKYKKNNVIKAQTSVRNAQMSHNYGITVQEYNNLLALQEFKCKICKVDQAEFKHRLSVDHCHKTNKIRGLLCNNCNNGLGRFKDNISFLEEAIRYLSES